MLMESINVCRNFVRSAGAARERAISVSIDSRTKTGVESIVVGLRAWKMLEI